MESTEFPPDALAPAIAWVPAGAWAVAVSGGADSVALLVLLHERQERRGDVRLHVVHLDHETRGVQSAADAAFVASLARDKGLACTLETRSGIESTMAWRPANPSARYRAARLEFFRRVVGQEGLAGVLLAHHADDQAETVLLRLLKAGGPRGLAGMRGRAQVGGLTLLRPLLGIPRQQLLDQLKARGQAWREDPSNQSPQYLRNRVRPLLQRHVELRLRLLRLARALNDLRRWVRCSAPQLEATFAMRQLCDVPLLLAREAARHWLAASGATQRNLADDVLDRLLAMARDAAAPARCQFPGGLTVRRKRGMIFVDRAGAC